MRFDGKLVRWDDERGFGFIAADEGGQQLFVHVSAFPRDGRRPQLNEAVSFEIELNPEQKKRAVKVQRLGAALPRPARRDSAPHHTRTSAARRGTGQGSLRRVLAWVLLLVLGATAAYAFHVHRQRASADARPAQPLVPSPTATSANTAPTLPAAMDAARPDPAEPAAAAALRTACDGRQHCSQMKSCAEARYFLKHCPGVKMDGDNDGHPCEETVCAGAWR